MSARAGKGIFSFISKNPTIIGLGILAVTLFIFRDRISNFVSGGITGTGQAITGAVGATGEFFGGAAEATGEFFGGIPESIGEFFGNLIPTAAAEPTVVGGTGEAVAFDPFGGLGEFFTGIADAFGNIFQAIIPTTVEGAGAEDLPIVSDVPAISPIIPVAPSIAEETIAPFIGGGPSFEGGTIFETPIEFLSLSQIIDRFMVTASQAADIRAQAIGFTPEEQAFLSPISTVGDEFGGILGGSQITEPAVSDPAFAGLTPEEIAARLTGGFITNF